MQCTPTSAMGSSAGQGGIGDPLAGGEVAGIGVLGVSQLWLADAALSHLVPQVLEGAVVAEVLAYSEEHSGGLRGGLHLGRLPCVEGQRLLAEDSLAVAEREPSVVEVHRVRAGDEDSVHVWRGAELVRARKGC